MNDGAGEKPARCGVGFGWSDFFPRGAYVCLGGAGWAMKGRTSTLLPTLLTGLVLLPHFGLAQGPATGPSRISTNQTKLIKQRTWPIAGHIMTPDGKPMPGVKVQVDIGIPAFPPQQIETNLKGEYRAEYHLDATANTKLEANVVASKEGFSTGKGSVELTEGQGSREINLVLREEAGDSNLPSLSPLTEGIAGRFCDPGVAGPRVEAKADYQRGLERMLNDHDSAGAVGPLESAVRREPNCFACRVLLALALLDTGRWDAASEHLEEAAKLTTSAKAGPARPEPFLILGALEMWRQDLPKALGFFMKGLEIRPDDPMVLLEAGRALVDQGNWEAADEYLEKAIHAGASPEAGLLRIQALLELGENEEAEKVMKAYLGDRRPMDLPLEDRMVYARLKERLELKAYEQSRTVIDWPVEELIRTIPALQGLEPADSQKPLDRVLARVQQNVERFFRQMPNTVSVEEIHEESLNRKGEVTDSLDESFQYLLLTQPEKSELGLREFRTPTTTKEFQSRTLQLGHMRTSGFACHSLHLHPAYRAKVNLRLLGRQMLDRRLTWVIAFAQRPENAHVLTRFEAEGKSSPVLIQGVAWIDPENFQILRMHTDLLKPPPNTHLIRQTTDVRYGEVSFKEVATPLWLPKEVTVTVHWKDRIFRNRHRYSDYKMFKVETEEKHISGVNPTSPPDRPR
jgi:tetratricopeptide (TPR) repeat protein